MLLCFWGFLREDGFCAGAVVFDLVWFDLVKLSEVSVLVLESSCVVSL